MVWRLKTNFKSIFAFDNAPCLGTFQHLDVGKCLFKFLTWSTEDTYTITLLLCNSPVPPFSLNSPNRTWRCRFESAGDCILLRLTIVNQNVLMGSPGGCRRCAPPFRPKVPFCSRKCLFAAESALFAEECNFQTKIFPR
jgi:hypothetical protein